MLWDDSSRCTCNSHNYISRKLRKRFVNKWNDSLYPSVLDETTLGACLCDSQGPPGLRVAVGQWGVAAASIVTLASNPSSGSKALILQTHTHTQNELKLVISSERSVHGCETRCGNRLCVWHKAEHTQHEVMSTVSNRLDTTQRTQLMRATTAMEICARVHLAHSA